ncbi:MAG: DUF3810 domain-containing protein [Flavobacteriaceae bacterium]|nr:DUF3810 domain-containing protein [Flavobacteriaceae bacterium]
MHNSKKYRILAVLLIAQWFFIKLISNYPELVESYYSKGIYPVISQFFRFIFGWIPFSIGDILYVILVFYILKSIVKIIRKKRINFIKILASISVIYFCFHFFWGFNYYREPLHKTLAINELKYSTKELESFTNQLIDKVNHLQLLITQNDTIKVVLPFSKKEIYQKVENGYSNLSESYPQFTYKTKSIKNSLISLPLTYMGFSGYLNPFTGEAQVNNLNPAVSYAATACHEVAHQLGYAAENEANFIGFLSAINNEDIYFQYSGYYMALRYALNDLYRHDKEKYKIALKKINNGILKNMQESQDFWNSYENPLEVYFKNIFNLFLKVNKQPKGIKSYNGMVGMLINYNKQNTDALQFLK